MTETPALLALQVLVELMSGAGLVVALTVCTTVWPGLKHTMDILKHLLVSSLQALLASMQSWVQL